MFILGQFILFQSFKAPVLSPDLDEGLRRVMIAALPTNFSDYLLSNTWQLILLLVIITVIWLIGTGITHGLAFITRGQANFLDILVLTSLLLPLLVLFAAIFPIFTLTVLLKTGLFITLSIILAIFLIIISIRALIRGISSTYTLAPASSIFILFINCIVFILIAVLGWSMIT